MKILFNEIERAKKIINKLSFTNCKATSLFFDIDLTEEKVADTLIVMTDTVKKNVGYAGLTRLGILKESTIIKAINRSSNYCYVNLDYCPMINLEDLFKLGLAESDLSEEDIEFICSKDCYLVKEDNILASFL